METAAELRVLILAPRGRDAGLAAGILARAGMICLICVDIADLVRAAAEGAGAALVTEEALDGDDDERLLLHWLTTQPPWSDFPFVVLAAARSDLALGARTPAWLDKLGNVVLLERPLGAAALRSAVRAALRARRRQYQVRAYLSELAALNASLELRVTERTAELRAAYDRLENEVHEREQTESRLAQAQRMEALGQLAGGIAHDFNNVLQAVTGGLSLIQRRSNDAEVVKQIAGMVGDAAQRGASVTGRLLAFARQGALRAEPVSPRPLLEGLCEMLAHTLGAGVAIEVAADQNLPALFADKSQLELVLVNLAVNARDAMPNGGRLLLAAAREVVLDKAHPAGLASGCYLRLSVSDTGVGMTAATLARASEPFFTTKPVGQGTGLGLSMARGFAHQSGGAITIASSPGQGTTVTLWFPEAVSALVVSDPVLSGSTALSFPVSARILVVDDDAIVREVLANQMEEQGYRVARAGDGLEALAELDAGAAVDLLISDFAMPGMNGVTLIEEARRRRPELPAVLLTGYADASVRLAVKDAGAGNTALLRKPVSGTALAECAAALLAHAAAPGG